jgi:hypothetical protein
VLNQKSHPRDLRYPEICHCQVVRFLQVPGAVNDMGKVDVGRVRESHGSRRKYIGALAISSVRPAPHHIWNSRGDA